MHWYTCDPFSFRLCMMLEMTSLYVWYQFEWPWPWLKVAWLPQKKKYIYICVCVCLSVCLSVCMKNLGYWLFLSWQRGKDSNQKYNQLLKAVFMKNLFLGKQNKVHCFKWTRNLFITFLGWSFLIIKSKVNNPKNGKNETNGKKQGTGRCWVSCVCKTKGAKSLRLFSHFVSLLPNLVHVLAFCFLISVALKSPGPL